MRARQVRVEESLGLHERERSEAHAGAVHEDEPKSGGTRTEAPDCTAG